MTSEHLGTEIHPEEMPNAIADFHMVAEPKPAPSAITTSPPLHNDSSNPTSSWMASLERDLLHHDPHTLPDHLWQRSSFDIVIKDQFEENIVLEALMNTHACEFGGILPRHLPALPEVCHQTLGGHLASGVSPLEPCLPTSASSRHAAAAVPIATTAGAAAATTSSSSRLCICCAAAETVATSPTTSRGKRGEHQSVPALSLSCTHINSKSTAATN